MSSVYEVRWRVLRERVEGILARAEQEHGDEEFVGSTRRTWDGAF